MPRSHDHVQKNVRTRWLTQTFALSVVSHQGQLTVKCIGVNKL